MTGVCTGGVLSRETRRNQGADAVELTGRQNTCARKGEGTSDPARSKTSSTCRNSMRENREIPCLPLGDGPGGRAGKVDDRTPAMHRRGKSDSSILPTKPPDRSEGPWGGVQPHSEAAHHRVVGPTQSGITDSDHEVREGRRQTEYQPTNAESRLKRPMPWEGPV